MATATSADAVLIRRLRERDRTAWDEVYALYGPRLRAFAYRLAGNSHDADDLVQETFVRALPRLDRLDPNTLELGPYLFTTLRNTFLKGVERQRRVSPVDEVPEPDVPAPIELDPERRTLLGAQREEVQLANARLAPRQRLVLALCELEERSYAEIGEVVGLKENAVAQLISRARESLRAELRLAQIDPGRLPEECRRFLPLLSRHLDRQLRGEQQERTLAHLESCERCQDVLTSMREASRRYRTFIPPFAPDDAHAASVDAELTAANYWDAPRRGGSRLRSRVGAAAVVAVLAVLGSTGVGAALLASDKEPAAVNAVFLVPPASGHGPAKPPVARAKHVPKLALTPRRPSVPSPARPRPRAVAPPATATVKETVVPPRAASKPPSAAPRHTAPRTHAPTSPPPRVVDRHAPAVTITARPPELTLAVEASFAFRASEPSTFTCRLDAGVFEACASPTTYTALAPGAHSFAVRALDGAGNLGQATEAHWTIEVPDTTAPVATIASASMNGGDAAFSFVSSEDGSTFECALDSGPLEPCSSPRAYTGLGYGAHSFSVRATDAARNIGPPAAHSWTIVQPLPNLVISQLTETSFTVTNSGIAPAGPFVVSVTLIGTFTFPALAPGQSATRVWSACRIGTLTAVADRGLAVVESDEDDNARSLVSDC